MEQDFVFCELWKGLNKDIKIVNKLLIKVAKTKEQLNTLDCLKLFLIIDYFCLFKVCFNIIYINNKTQVFYISDFKFIFINIYLKVNILKIL